MPKLKAATLPSHYFQDRRARIKASHKGGKTGTIEVASPVHNTVGMRLTGSLPYLYKLTLS